jgi:rsbT co-antagonist protein RsbR
MDPDQDEQTQELRFFQLSLDMLCTASLDTGCFVRLNPIWSQVLGFTEDELRAGPFIDFVHPEDRDATLAAAAQLATGRDVISFANRYLTRSGDYRWIEWMSTADLAARLIYAVARDVTSRKLAEEALRASEQRAADLLVLLQERNLALQRQADALRELATPVLPLAEDVIAMPLIGEIDPTRAHQIMESLLVGVAAARVGIAIIDITGVRRLDRDGAQALLRAAQAIELLGATAVLTGIRPGIAQTLVELGINLDTLIIRSTLREGISFAFERAARSSRT